VKINTALILCAGYGKRLNPLTLDIPKPLLKINNLTFLENTINLIKELGIENIILNTFYLKDQIQYFIKKKNFNLKIKIIDDGEEILDTGGGILNMVNSSLENDFLVFNPDSIWSKDYVQTIQKMEDFYFFTKIQNILMVVNKNYSYDKKLKGDFYLVENILKNFEPKNFIFTGCQIINKKLIKDIKIKKFPINEIWNNLVKKNKLYGFEDKNKFYHVTNLEIYQKLLKNY
jgi:MurNAc alpha-1-phosphate uridylyltransferase|tara:strand:+ start:234 stop:926 length:693 start_codon:yes stop_codon:yes gene_type:complete